MRSIHRESRDPGTRRRVGALAVAAALLVVGACGTTDSADEPRANEAADDRSSPNADTSTIVVDDDHMEPPAAPTLDDDVFGDEIDFIELSELVELSPIIVRATIPSEPAEISDIERGPVGVGLDAVALRDITIREVLKDDPHEYQAALTPRLSTEPGAHRFGVIEANDSELLASLSRSDMEVLLFLAGIGDPVNGVLSPAGGILGIFLIHDEILEPMASKAAFAAGTSFEEARRQIDATIEEHAARTVLESPPREIELQAYDMPSAIVPDGWTVRQSGRIAFEFEAAEPPGTVVAAVCATHDLTGSIVTNVCDIRDAVVVDVDSAEPVTIEVPILAEGIARLGNAEVLDCAEVQCWLVVASGSDLALRVGLAIDQ